MDEIREWVRSDAIPLATVEAGNGFADLQPLRAIIGNARIVSLGEATHGTREFFQLKHRLLEFCVCELGFTIFGIEASYPECLRVNDYVLHGTGNAADALAGTRFWTWDTQEVLALIEWMRTWNSTHERKVKFYGFDMQFPTEAALGVLDYLRRVEPDLAAASEELLWPLSDDFTSDHFSLLPEATRETALACVARLLEAFTREQAAWTAATSALEWGQAQLNAVVLDQSARLRAAGSKASFSLRDVAMAENVGRLREIEGPGAKAVLWAHNGHVAKESSYLDDAKASITNMGNRLHAVFGPRHVVIGFTFNQGQFQAIEMGRGLVDHTVPAATEGSLDFELAATEIPMFLLGLSGAPTAGAVSDWLASKPASRSVGAVFSEESAQDYLERSDPRRAYDVLAFVETTTAARPTNAGRRSGWTRPEMAPEATNLAFSGSSDIPGGWAPSPPRPTHAHEVALSDERSPAGGPTVSIKRAAAPWRWGDGRLEQTFSAEAWRGKRLRFVGAVRAEVQERGAGAQLYIQSRPKTPEGSKWMVPATDMAMLEPPVRSSSWSTQAVEIVVPENAHSIVIGMALAGDGQAWFGDLDLVPGQDDAPPP